MPQGGCGRALCPPASGVRGGGGDGQARETAGPEAGGREGGAFPQTCPAPEHREPPTPAPGAASCLLTFRGLGPPPWPTAFLAPLGVQEVGGGVLALGSLRSGWGVLALFLRWHWGAMDCPHSITQPQLSPLRTGNADPWACGLPQWVGGYWGVTSPMGVFSSFRGPPHTHGRLCSPARGLRRGGQRSRVDTEPPEGLRGVGAGAARTGCKPGHRWDTHFCRPPPLLKHQRPPGSRGGRPGTFPAINGA